MQLRSKNIKIIVLGCGQKHTRSTSGLPKRFFNLIITWGKLGGIFLAQLADLWPLCQVDLTLLVSVGHGNLQCVLSVSTICSKSTNSSEDNDSGIIHSLEDKRSSCNFPSIMNVILWTWTSLFFLPHSYWNKCSDPILFSMQLSRQGGHDLVSPEVSSHTLLQDFKPLTFEPLKDYVHVFFFLIYSIHGKCWLSNRSQKKYSMPANLSLQWKKKIFGYYLTDIMSSLCHPPCKSPWGIIKENRHRAYMHWLLIW